MIEYTDGKFGTIAPADAVMELLQKTPLDNIKAVHFGSIKELVDIRLKKGDYSDLHNRMEELERELKALKPTGIVKVYSLEDIPRCE